MIALTTGKIQVEGNASAHAVLSGLL